MFPEDHPAFAGLYWGPVSSPGVAALVESADAYLFAGGLLSDYSTTGYSALIDPKKLLLANPDDVRLPGARYTGVVLADFLAALAEEVRPNPASLDAVPPRQRRRPGHRYPAGPPFAPIRPPRPRRGRCSPGSSRSSDDRTALLVETGDSWFNGLKLRSPAAADSRSSSRPARSAGASRPRWATSWAAPSRPASSR